MLRPPSAPVTNSCELLPKYGGGGGGGGGGGNSTADTVIVVDVESYATNGNEFACTD